MLPTRRPLPDRAESSTGPRCYTISFSSSSVSATVKIDSPRALAEYPPSEFSSTRKMSSFISSTHAAGITSRSMNSSADTPKNTASFRPCALLMARLPLMTSET